MFVVLCVFVFICTHRRSCPCRAHACGCTLCLSVYLFVNMFVCLWLYACVALHAFMTMCLCICLWVCRCVFVCICICDCVCVHLWFRACAYERKRNLLLMLYLMCLYFNLVVSLVLPHEVTENRSPGTVGKMHVNYLFRELAFNLKTIKFTTGLSGTEDPFAHWCPQGKQARMRGRADAWKGAGGHVVCSLRQ